MNPYYNLPPEQRTTQRLVDQFNADKRLWKKLEPKRRARHKVRLRPRQVTTGMLCNWQKARSSAAWLP